MYSIDAPISMWQYIPFHTGLMHIEITNPYLVGGYLIIVNGVTI